MIHSNDLARQCGSGRALANQSLFLQYSAVDCNYCIVFIIIIIIIISSIIITIIIITVLLFIDSAYCT